MVGDVHELARLGEDEGLALNVTLTREQPAGWGGWARRVNADVVPPHSSSASLIS